MSRCRVKRAVAYLRTNDGCAQKQAAQRETIAAWARRSGVAIVAWHADFASGMTRLRQRPGLRHAMADLKTHQANVLIVATADRIARSSVEIARLEIQIHRRGAELRCADRAV
jgi:DNA invertase Pin-like site-specific DNA recombinase